jgi:ribosomal protein L21
LKAKLKLYCTDPDHEDFDTVIQDVYLGPIPYMTPKGTFVINEAEVGSDLKFDKVLFTGDDKTYNVGKPYVSGAIVEAKVTKQGRDRKIHILKYKAKSKYRRSAGHRQHYTEIEITKI